MTDWEISFIESVSERASNLTDKQADMLERIYTKIFD